MLQFNKQWVVRKKKRIFWFFITSLRKIIGGL